MTGRAGLRFEPVMDIRLNIGPSRPFGQSAYGRRAVVPITGGVFSGDGLRGGVMAGGSDWQVARSDGTTIVDAHFAIETRDRVRIQVMSRGLYLTAEPGYYRTAIRFVAPAGRYAWLNAAQFVGHVAATTNRVSQRLYRVV